MSPKRYFRPHLRPSRPQRHYDHLAVLDVIDRFHQTHQRSPSQREITRALQMSAPSVAHNAIHALARQGLLTSTPTGRGLLSDLQLTPAGQQRLHQWRAARAAAAASGPDTSTVPDVAGRSPEEPTP